MSGLNSALASITASYTDSDDEGDTTLSPVEDSLGDVELVSHSPKEVLPEPEKPEPNLLDVPQIENRNSTGAGLVSYIDPIDDDAIDDYTPEIIHESEDKDDDMDTSPSQVDDSEPIPDPAAKRRALLPPEPKGACSAKLQSKFNKLHEDKLRGKVNMNEYIQNRKMFRNPSIYEKLIQYCNIKEFGTNYPPEVFDPYGWPESSNYLNLAKLQKEEMDRREKARKERVKIEYVSGAAKKPVGVVTSIPSVGTSSAPVVVNPNPGESETKRKSKWDQKAVLPTVITKK